MQSIKNALHKNSSNDNTTAHTAGNDNYTGSTTGDSTHTNLSNRDDSRNLAGREVSGHDQTLGSTPAYRETRETSTATGPGRASSGAAHLDHSSGHDHSVGSKFDPTAANVTHDHKHLNHVSHVDHRTVEVEEVERQRDVDRHVHHVQHHVQPVVDKQVRDEVHHTNAVPVTEVREQHASTDEDRKLMAGLTSQYKDTETHRGKERTIVDLGEKVHENVQHHVHHVTQPVLEQEVVDRHRIHTVIPVHQTTHEAPIVHKSSTHEPVTMDSFLQGGGKLSSGITHENANVLNSEGCDTRVDGPAHDMMNKLHLGSSSSTYGAAGVGGASRTRRPGKKVGRSGSMSSVSSSDEENGVRTSRQDKRNKRKGLFSSNKETDTDTNATRI